jgi:AbiTii
VSAFERLLTLVEEQPLSRSLPVALRVATMIADEEWASWIKLELMGYLRENPAMKENTVVPEYRGVPGVWYDDYDRALAITNPDLSFINELRLRHGVAELEGIATSTDTLAMRPPEFSKIIHNNFHVEVSIFKFRPSSVSQVLLNIKMCLLEHLTSRREKVKTIPDIQVPSQAEILQLKPTIYGMGIDLKALWRRLFSSNE